MFYFILSIILSTLIGILCYYRSYDEDLGFSIGVIIFIVLMAVSLFNNFIGYTEVEYEKVVYEIEGLELQNEETVNGNFLLGTGYITSSNKIQYIYFAKTEFGKQLKTEDASTIYLVETNEKKPQLIEKRKQKIRKTNFIDKLWSEEEENKILLDILEKKILIVPENTIQIEYKVEV